MVLYKQTLQNQHYTEMKKKKTQKLGLSIENLNPFIHLYMSYVKPYSGT